MLYVQGLEQLVPVNSSLLALMIPRLSKVFLKSYKQKADLAIVFRTGRSEVNLSY